MFSVVVPLYNKAPFILETVQSVLNQLDVDFELLVINDGSTDGSLDQISGITDDRLKVFTIPHSGVSVARNTGIAESRFEWIAFLDADDWWDPSFLKEIAVVIDRHPDNCIFAGGRSRVFDSGAERYTHALLPEEGQTGTVNYYEVIEKYLPPLNASNAVIKKSLLEEVGLFKPGQSRHEDHDLWFRLCARYDVVFVNKPLSFYRKTKKAQASQDVMSVPDFLSYLDTMKRIIPQLTAMEQEAARKFYNRFVIWAYARGRETYDKAGRIEIRKGADAVLTSGTKRMLWIIDYLPFNLVAGLKKLYRG